MSAPSAERLALLVDRQDILDTVTRFARAMDRFDRELFLSAFHADAVIDAGSYVGGPAELYDWARDLHDAGQSATLHNLLNHSCEVDGDVAHAETYYLFIGRNRDETNWSAGGRYLDRFERRDGAWRIAFRRTTLEWSGLVPTTPLPFADVPDLNASGAPARDASDPSYQRPYATVRERQRPF